MRWESMEVGWGGMGWAGMTRDDRARRDEGDWGDEGDGCACAIAIVRPAEERGKGRGQGASFVPS